MSRWLAYTVGLGAIALVVSPAFSQLPQDSYPLSTYPMFSQKRENPWIHLLVGVSPTRRAPLPPSLVVAGPEVMQAASTIINSVNSGAASMQRLCEEVAARATRDPAWQGLLAVELVAVQFDPVAYFAVGQKPIAQQVLSRCDAPRAE